MLHDSPCYRHLGFNLSKASSQVNIKGMLCNVYEVKAFNGFSWSTISAVAVGLAFCSFSYLTQSEDVHGIHEAGNALLGNNDFLNLNITRRPRDQLSTFEWCDCRSSLL